MNDVRARLTWSGVNGAPAYPFHEALLGRPAPALDVTEVRRPADYPYADPDGPLFEADFAELEQRTYAVEVQVPKSEFQTDVLPGFFGGLSAYPEDATTRLYGWYLVGDGLAGGRVRPLLFYISGTSITMDWALRVNPSHRRLLSAFVASGFDVLWLDLPGQGYSSGIYEFRGGIVLDSLRALEQGSWTMGPLDDAPVWRGVGNGTSLLGGSAGIARSKPVVLAGFSAGARIMERAMALNYTSSSDIEPPSVTVGPGPHGFDLRGVIDIGGPAGCDYSRPSASIPGAMLANAFPGSGFDPARTYDIGGALDLYLTAADASVGYASRAACSVFDSMSAWPAYMAVGGAGPELFSPISYVDAFNEKARGFKEIVLVRGGHLAWFVDESRDPFVPGHPAWPLFDLVLARMTSFARQAVIAKPPAGNHGQTTLREQVCRARGPADGIVRHAAWHRIEHGP